MQRLKLLALAALLVSAGSALAADRIMPPHFTNFAEAKAASAEKGVPLLIDFWKYD